MKRTIALIFSLILAMTMLAGCGDDDVYRQPGTGTTLKNPDVSTLPDQGDADGSYSADENGDVGDTTGTGMVEEGIDDIEDGIDQGMDDLGEGLEEMGDGAEDMLNGDNGTETDGGMNSDGSTDNGYSHGSTNGNSH